MAKLLWRSLIIFHKRYCSKHEGLQLNNSILYIGSLDESCNSYSRYRTLGAMGNRVTGIDTDPFIYGGVFEKFLLMIPSTGLSSISWQNS